MKNECNIIRDILPLYAERMVSPDTEAFVSEHLKNCADCQREYEQIKEPQPIRESSDAAPLIKLKKKMAAKKIQTIALTAVFVITLLVSAFAVLDAPTYFPYSEDLLSVESVGDCGLRITFREGVTDFDYRLYADPEGGNFYYCDIQAWTSLWDKWFSKEKGSLSVTVFPREPYPIAAVYIPNNGSANVCISDNTDYEEHVVLPRLSLGYFLILAVAALGVTAAVWLLTRKKAELHIWAGRIALYPVAYIISHCIVSGIGTASYSLQRDLFLIIFLSLLLYGGMLLAYRIRRLKKEIKEIGSK